MHAVNIKAAEERMKKRGTDRQRGNVMWRASFGNVAGAVTSEMSACGCTEADKYKLIGSELPQCNVPSCS